MNRLRWVTEGGGHWEVDVSTPTTIDGVARPLPNNGPLPLGLSRGTQLSRPKQVDFFQKFMFAPFVPSYSLNTLFLQRALTIPSGNDWYNILLGQFNVQKFVSLLRNDKSKDSSSWVQLIGRHLCEKSLYAFGICSEYLVTSNGKLFFAYEGSGDTNTSRKKAVFHQKFPNFQLTLEGISPGLYIDKNGNYWDVPITLAADVASNTTDSGASYHLSLQHISGSVKQVGGNENESIEVPSNLLPGLYLKSAFSFKKNIDFWRSQSKKLKFVQPFDFLLSSSRVSGSCLVGLVGTALIGENSLTLPCEDQPNDYRRYILYASRGKSAFLADLFASLSFSAQYGDFQRNFFDLTRVHVRLDVPSGSKFFSAGSHLARNLYMSQQPSLEAVQAICPNAKISFQQQIAGPFSFRVDSEIGVNLKSDGRKLNFENPVFGIEYALQVLFSAKAIAWYAPKQKEFMVELRFLER